MIHQSFVKWQQAPVQGAIPASPILSADALDLGQQLEGISAQLEGIQVTTEAYRHSCPKLAETIANALTAVQQALAVLENSQAYTVIKD